MKPVHLHRVPIAYSFQCLLSRHQFVSPTFTPVHRALLADLGRSINHEQGESKAAGVFVVLGQALWYLGGQHTTVRRPLWRSASNTVQLEGTSLRPSV